MIINSITVFNFGKLHDFTLDFNGDLNIICEQNGWGKSTIASFVKVMLYGFEGENNRDQFTKERKRFYPWHGGTFGGSMDFTVDGHKYKITRIFHEKQNLDEFDLRDFETNMPSNDYSQNIGEELFNINSESFLKTVFIKQSDSSVTGVSGDINSKLGNISDSIDLNKFENAMDLLKSKSNSLVPNRKTGEINKLQSRASEIKGDLKGISSLEKSIDEVTLRINEAGCELKNLNESLAELNKQKDIAIQYEKNVSIRKSFEQMQSEVEEKQNKLEADRKLFEGNVPSSDTINDWNNISRQIATLETTVDNLKLDFEENNKFDSLSQIFALSDIDEHELASVLSEASELEEITKKASIYELSSAEQEKLSVYSSKFGGIENPLLLVKEKIQRLDEVRKLNIKLDSAIAESKVTNDTINNIKKNNHLFMIVLGIILLIAATGCLVVGKFKTGFILGAVPLYVTGIILIILFVSKITKKKAEIENLKHTESQNRENIKSIEDLKNTYLGEVNSFLINTNSSTESDKYFETLQSLMLEASAYENLCQNAREKEAYLTQSGYRQKLENVLAYVRKFNISPSDYSYGALNDICGKYQLYKSLSAKKKNHDRAQADLDKLISKLKEALAFYNIDPGINIGDTIDGINASFSQIAFDERAYKNALSNMEKFLENNPDFDKDEVLSEHPLPMNEILNREKEIENVVSGINERINTDKRTLGVFVEDYERKQELADELEELENIISEKTIVYERLLKTQEFLLKAKENLTVRYMGPLLNGFKKYYTMLTGDNADNYQLDANINLTCLVEGLQRETRTLSIGYQDLDGLCMRLAMADAMYPGEKPVLILDDPFVNLDDGKTARVKGFLNEVAREYQIIYMTCSDSRI